MLDPPEEAEKHGNNLVFGAHRAADLFTISKVSGGKNFVFAVFERLCCPILEVRTKGSVHLVEPAIRKDENAHSGQIGKVEQRVLTGAIGIEPAPFEPLDAEQLFQRALALFHTGVHDELLTRSQVMQDRKCVIANLSLKLPHDALYLGKQIEILLAQAILGRAGFHQF